MANLGIEVQGNGFATSRSFIKSQRGTALSALRGYVEAIHFIHRNRDESRKIVAKYLRLSDPELADATYTAFVKGVPKRPYPTLKGIQFLLDEVAAKLPNAKSAKPEQFVDLSLLQQLEKKASLPRWQRAIHNYSLPNWFPAKGGCTMNLVIGRRFPDIELPDQDGQQTKLSELVGKFPFILSFYRGYW